MRPLPKLEIRNLELEIEERLASLAPMQSLAVVKSFKGKCYGIGFSEPKEDLILRNLVRVMGGLYRPRPAAAVNMDVTLYDTTGASRTVRVHGDVSGFLYAGLGGTMLGFGNPATTPTPARTDYELQALVSTITPSITTTDETNWRVITTGSYVWAAGGTVRETGKYLNLYERILGEWRLFLIYHDAVADVVVPAGGTVSVTYTTQF